jgi:hypothetical protein
MSGILRILMWGVIACHLATESWATPVSSATEVIVIGTMHSAHYPGKRLVVLTGYEHRYRLRELLAQQKGVSVKEFWEVAPK